MEQKARLYASHRSQTLGLSGIREIFEKAQTIPDVIRLEFGEPDFDTPSNIKEAAIRAIDKGYTKYSSSSGIPELRRAVSEKLKKDNNVEYDPSKEVIVTAGATAAINLALLATLDAGDEILVPDPGWATYVHAVNLVGAKPVLYPLNETEDFQFKPRVADRLVGPKTKAILINTPANPMGSILSRKSIQEIAEFSLHHNLYVIADEVYEKFLYQDEGSSDHISIASLNEMKERTVTINALSKTYAMTGWRIGYAAANSTIAGAMTRINAAASSCVSTIAQYAALEALTGSQDSVSRMISAFAQRRRILVSGLNEFKGFKCSMPRGAFYAFPNIKGTGFSSKDLAMKIIDESHVATVPGSAFGNQGEGYLRIAYANSIENIQQALERMKKILQPA
ncbi:MAG: pyridoxal phosphate-dependent aminotransferase [Thaumarchaeota archaeon]|nr:pyridoxal phosphate-dependent aminotransferase [Nitrososphaerota archaeon]